MYQSGFPDIFAAHHSYRHRWIEIKADKYSFTAAQLRDFPQFSAACEGIWILGECCESEYLKLWRPPNWHMFTSIMRL